MYKANHKKNNRVQNDGKVLKGAKETKPVKTLTKKAQLHAII